MPLERPFRYKYAGTHLMSELCQTCFSFNSLLLSFYRFSFMLPPFFQLLFSFSIFLSFPPFSSLPHLFRSIRPPFSSLLSSFLLTLVPTLNHVVASCSSSFPTKIFRELFFLLNFNGSLFHEEFPFRLAELGQ